MHHLTPLALEYWQSSPHATRSAETLAALCTQLAATYAQPQSAAGLQVDAVTEARQRGWLPRETLVCDAYALSSGTMATLTGISHCSQLDDIQNRFALWCAGKDAQDTTWQDAWTAYWPRDPAHPAVPSLEALAQTITTLSQQTQAQLDKEAIEIEIKTRLRPRKAQGPPVGLFAQPQETLFSS